MLSSSIQDEMRKSARASIREAHEYLTSLQLDEPEGSDTPDSHKQASLNNIKIMQAADEARVQSESRTSNDTFPNATDADPDQEEGSEADHACPPSDPSYSLLSGSYHSPGPSPGSSSGLHQNNNFLLEEDGNITKLVQQSIAAAIVCKLIKLEYAFKVKAFSWHRWCDHCYWKHCEASEADAAVTELIQQGTGSKGFNIGYQRGVIEIMKKLKSIELPKFMPGTIPFRNGLLDISTKRLHPINQENATTWALPYEYAVGAQCFQFLSWIRQAVDGDEETVQLLRAYINAVLVGRPELQIFLHLTGPAGTGKSTFGRMLFRLVGDENTTTTTLKQLENNRFETANIYGKRLVAIEEVHKYGGSVSVLKSMTGQDPLRLERKNQQQAGSFIFEGQTIMMSNERFVTNDHTSGIERRRITVEFSHRISQGERASWHERGGEEAILYTEIPGIINWALGLTDQEVRTAFKEIPKRIRQANLDAARANNSVLDWMLESLIPETNASVQIGNKHTFQDGGETKFKDADTRLYPHYLTWCRCNAKQPLSLQRFGTVMVDQSATYGVATKHVRKKDGTKITGMRFRQDSETFWLDSI